MATDIIYLVFLSSTFDDLREERTEVQKALLKLRCMPIGMEQFGSADQETWEFIKRQIDECDYYVVIIAGRYGSIAPDGISFTEKEYDYAKAAGKPVLSFIHADRGSIPHNKSEDDPEKRRKLDLFIAKVKQSPVSSFGTSHELAANVIVSFVNESSRRPAVGFIRADQVADLKKYAELLEQNAALEAELAALKAARPSIFGSASDIIRIEAVTGRPQTRIREDGGRVVSNTDPEEQKCGAELSWGQLFVCNYSPLSS